MHAVIRAGGKQYKVEKGDKLKVETLDKEAGKSIKINDVLMVIDGEKVTVGTPIKAVSAGAFSVTNLAGMNLTGVKTGSMLVYDAAEPNGGGFVVDSDMSSIYVEINGGTF